MYSYLSNLVELLVFKLLLICCRSWHEYHQPLDVRSLESLTRKNFSDETMKKINWVYNMFQDWRNYRNTLELTKIHCDLSEPSTINEYSVKFALCRFITEVKKLDGSDFPARTLYDITICFQFYL